LKLRSTCPFRKQRGLHTKAIFRDAFTEMLPARNANLPKRGFNAPLALYMRDLDPYFDSPASLRDRFGEHIGSTWRNGLLDWNLINALRADHRCICIRSSFGLHGLLQVLPGQPTVRT
jgi:hypothetical protein